jgi:photosystem II stability/assembly factor-like uncharacterized protein
MTDIRCQIVDRTPQRLYEAPDLPAREWETPMKVMDRNGQVAKDAGRMTKDRMRMARYIGCIGVFLLCMVVSLSGEDELARAQPHGFWTRAIAIDPINTSVIRVGSIQGNKGIYETTDGGTHWESVSNGLTDLNIQCIIINPGNTDILYAGTSDGGVFKSIDGGRSWTSKNSGLPSGRDGDILVQCLAIDPDEPERLYAGHDLFGLYRSLDGGESWQLTEVAHIFVRDIAVNPVDPDVVYAVTDFPRQPFRFLGGVVKSADGGDTWDDKLTNRELYDKSFYAIHDIEIYLNDPETVYIGATSSSSGYNSIYKSTDGGKHWINVNHNMNSIFTRSIALDPFDAGTIYVANEPFMSVSKGGVYKSTNDGLGWRLITKGLPTDVIQKVILDQGHPNILYLGTLHRGVFKSVDGGESWTELRIDTAMQENPIKGQ